MTTLIEQLDSLAGQTSERPWRSVHPYGSIITDGTSLNHMDEESRRAYGGGLICESVVSADREFICALANAWPQIRAALLAGKAMHDAHELWVRTLDGRDPDGHLVAIARREQAQQQAGAAIAPLFEERALAVREAQP